MYKSQDALKNKSPFDPPFSKGETFKWVPLIFTPSLEKRGHGRFVSIRRTKPVRRRKELFERLERLELQFESVVMLI